MSFMTFNYNKKLMYVIIYWPLEIIFRCLMYYKWEYFFKIGSNDAINEYMFIILSNIADLLSGFLVLYINNSMKKKQKPDNSDKILRESKLVIFLFKEPVLRKKKSFYYKIILICALDYLNRLAFFIFYQIF